MNEKTLQEVLKENKERYNQRLKAQREQIKKEQRKELIIVVAASMLILGLLFKVLSDMTDKGVKKCMEKGYSQITCEYVVG
jgi:hypothetical protein